LELKAAQAGNIDVILRKIPNITQLRTAHTHTHTHTNKYRHLFT